jgi:hypothetical protein
MPNFTNVELTDMVLAYGCGAAGGNAAQTHILYRIYREQFPDRVVTNPKTFASTVQGLRLLREIRKFHPRTEDRGSGWLNQKYRQDLRI